MRRFTQAELMSEGFWDRFKWSPKREYRVLKSLAKAAAPDIMDPLSRLNQHFKKGYKLGNDDTPRKISTKERVDKAETISKGLQQHNMSLNKGVGIRKFGKASQSGENLFKVYVTDHANNDQNKWVTVDSNGNLMGENP